LVRCIGGGAYGEVWLARNVLGELRAVKIIHRSRFSDPRPFEREFEGIQRFEPISRSHPSQLAILHVGKNEAAGCFYYVMELADAVERQKDEGRRQKSGESTESAPDSVTSSFSLLTSALPYVPRTLRHDLEQHGRLPVSDCIQIGLSLTTALAHLHQHGLVHRDIKPSNVVFVNGVPKLGDIGLVTEAGDTQSIVGTEGYLPPEGPGTVQADIFSLGKVLYEAVTGLDRRKFPALPDDLATMPERRALLEFNEILLKACAHDPRLRYASPKAMRADLERLHHGQSVRRMRLFEHSIRFAKRALPLAAVVAVSVAWLLVSRFNDSTIQRLSDPKPASIFVLPFRDDGTNKVDELLRSRMTDALIDGLALVEGMKVGPRKSGWLRRDETEVRQQVERLFGARYAISGVIRTVSDRLTVTVTLHETGQDAVLWTASFNGAKESYVDLAKQMIDGIAEAVGNRPMPEVKARIVELLQRNASAMRLYQQAPGITDYSKAGFSRKVQLLNEAIDQDPNFAKAHELLATAYLSQSDIHWTPAEAMLPARREANAALALDDTLSVAVQCVAWLATYFDRYWEAAEAHSRRGVELAPADYMAHWTLAKFLRAVGRLEEARLETAEAFRLAGPRSTGIMLEQLYAERRFSEATNYIKAATAGGADFYDGDVLLAAGRVSEGIAAIERTRNWDDGPEWISRLGLAHALAGHREQAEAALDDLARLAKHRYVSPYLFAVVHAPLGNHDACFTELDRALKERSGMLVGGGLYSLSTDIAWDSIRGDPRFAALLDRIDLTPAARKLALQRKLPE
jgi:serine/threonine protein kinase/tetratricopeptide (TPR) repeat protein